MGLDENSSFMQVCFRISSFLVPPPSSFLQEMRKHTCRKLLFISSFRVPLSLIIKPYIHNSMHPYIHNII